MNINENYTEQDMPSAVEITNLVMDSLFQIAIKPMESKLNEQQTALVAEAGIALKIIAREADAYRKLKSHGKEYYKN